MCSGVHGIVFTSYFWTWDGVGYQGLDVAAQGSKPECFFPFVIIPHSRELD